MPDSSPTCGGDAEVLTGANLVADMTMLSWTKRSPGEPASLLLSNSVPQTSEY